MNAENKEFIRPIGDYRGLIVYKKGECIYDLTFHFANRFSGQEGQDGRPDGAGGA